MTPAQFRKRVKQDLEVIDSRGDGPEDRRAHLQAMYRIGKVLDDFLPTRSANGSRRMEQLGEAIDRSEKWISTAREFAAKYSEEDLAELCEMPLGWSHVLLLLPVSDHRMRTRLRRQAVEQSWTWRQLQRAVRNRPGKRRGGGPRIRQPQTPREAVDRLEEATKQWIGVANVMADHLQPRTQKPAAQADEQTERVRTALQQMDRLVRRLRRDLFSAS